MRGYKVASIQNGTVHLACQLIAGKLMRKNRPTQVIGFIVDLTREMCRRTPDELGEVPSQPARIGLSAKLRIRAMSSTLAGS
jgi:hypothetical protein